MSGVNLEMSGLDSVGRAGLDSQKWHSRRNGLRHGCSPAPAGGAATNGSQWAKSRPSPAGSAKARTGTDPAANRWSSCRVGEVGPTTKHAIPATKSQSTSNPAPRTDLKERS